MTTLQVTGLSELRSGLKKLEDVTATKEVKNALMDAADYVAVKARGKVPHRSGKAAGSIKAFAQANRAGVKGGGSIPYYGWLDFGSRTPRYGNPRQVGPWSGSGKGPAKGRFIYPAIDENVEKIADMVLAGIVHIVQKAGLD